MLHLLDSSSAFWQIHYVAKWKGLTFMTSRQGMGVTGGTVSFLLPIIKYLSLQ
jgi:hypothetical protein